MRKSFGWVAALLLFATLAVPAMATDTNTTNSAKGREEHRKGMKQREGRRHEHDAHDRNHWREREKREEAGRHEHEAERQHRREREKEREAHHHHKVEDQRQAKHKS